jgi:predicted dehydrogenase
VRRTNRREFVGSLTAGALAGSRLVFGAAADRKLKLGVIGCGWYGMVDLNAAFRAGGAEAVALRDVDNGHLETSAADLERLQGSRPRLFKDYREFLQAPGLDAVIIATPPHWHALPFIAACEKGLAIYCEKPLAYDIREGQAMAAAARRHGNIVQIGFQRRQSDAFREAGDYVCCGNAGRLVQVEAQIHYQASVPDSKPQDPPASLDWDLWCGPAPKLPYSPAIGHKSWRLEKEYGNGHLVDWGIHLIDAIRVALGAGTPRSVQASGTLRQLQGKITTPDTLIAWFDFEPCPVVWRHRLWGAVEYAPEVNNGVFYYCEKETIFAADDRWIIMPAAKGAERKQITAKMKGEDQQTRHMAEFLASVREQKQPSCSPTDAADSAATVQLAMISYYTGSRVDWDPAARNVTGNPAAQNLLRRAYRMPWKHPFG